MPPGYTELHCTSNFTFLRGASHPEELVQQAKLLGYEGLALTDECSMAGVVRAHRAAQHHKFHLILGSAFRCDDLQLVLLCPDHEAYTELCGLITRARRAADKGSYRVMLEDFASGLDHCLALWVASAGMADERAAELAGWMRDHFDGRAWITAANLLRRGDRQHQHRLEVLGRQFGLPRVASGDVHMHRRGRRALQDVLTAIRLGRPVSELGQAVYANGERHLRQRRRLDACYPESWLQQTLVINERCRFNLETLRYQYPHELVPEGSNATDHLHRLVYQGMDKHWPEGAPAAVRRQVAHELRLIGELRYESYFLTVQDLVRFAREQDILCQGRGSAANSAVCFCLGVTAVDPARSNLLFERFISAERQEPPDIDVDFEHQRREEVMQYVYRKYGRDRAALAATVICYRPKSAIRDVGKALGLNADIIDALTRSLAWWDQPEQLPQQLRQAGLDPAAAPVRQLIHLVGQLLGFPRHLSQHVGGFVISEAPLATLVPVENASMAERTVIQWDKDDLESLGLLKVDCLALGMLTAIRRCFDLIREFHGRDLTLARIPAEDPATYAMIQKADTIGVFQIESRAQQAMLPRLKPRCFYDLVVEVAIVRPGPIQGDMVHPYLRRREHKEEVIYPSEALKPVLERTLGIPIFQEQVMQIAMVAADFTPGEADRLRRAMAAWKRRGGLEPFREKLLRGMRKNGYERDFAERLFEQIKGFGDYGFPESHSASFALLVYASSWLKCHYPAAFTCALLNSQPMGFYAPAQLLRDAQAHGVPVHPVDVRYSRAACHLETSTAAGRTTAIRLGLDRIKGLSADAMERLLQARHERCFRDVRDLARRAGLSRQQLSRLARAGALAGLAGHRHQAQWQALAVEKETPLLAGHHDHEEAIRLRPPDAWENLVNDYRSLRLSLGRHPMALLAGRLPSRRQTARHLRTLPHRSRAYAAGIVTMRQRPGTASGVVFVTLEDESGLINVVVWPKLVERQRRVLLGASLMGVEGRLETDGQVHHLIAERLYDHSELVERLGLRSRDFH